MGLRTEIKASKNFHQSGIPLLVSSRILRSRKLGQIDLSRLIKRNQGWCIEMAEVKNSFIGEMQMQKSQKYRLYSSQNFLSSIFGITSSLVKLIENNHHNYL